MNWALQNGNLNENIVCGLVVFRLTDWIPKTLFVKLIVKNKSKYSFSLIIPVSISRSIPYVCKINLDLIPEDKLYNHRILHRDLILSLPPCKIA